MPHEYDDAFPEFDLADDGDDCFGSCERRGCDLGDEDDIENELCGQCSWWVSNAGEG